MTSPFDRIKLLYEVLDKHADAQNEYVGSMAEAYRETALANAYYKSSFDLLVEMGGIAVLQRGNRTQQSRVRLYEEPTQDVFDATYKPNLTKPPTHAMLMAEIEGLRRRFPDIDLAAFIVSADSKLADHEARLAALEQREGNASDPQ